MQNIITISNNVLTEAVSPGLASHQIPCDLAYFFEDLLPSTLMTQHPALDLMILLIC